MAEVPVPRASPCDLSCQGGYGSYASDWHSNEKVILVALMTNLKNLPSSVESPSFCISLQ